MAASHRFLLVVLVSGGFDDNMHINSTSSACIMSKNSVCDVKTLDNCFSLYIAPVHSAVKMSTCMAIDIGGYVYE